MAKKSEKEVTVKKPERKYLNGFDIGNFDFQIASYDLENREKPKDVKITATLDMPPLPEGYIDKYDVLLGYKELDQIDLIHVFYDFEDNVMEIVNLVGASVEEQKLFLYEFATEAYKTLSEWITKNQLRWITAGVHHNFKRKPFLVSAKIEAEQDIRYKDLDMDKLEILYLEAQKTFRNYPYFERVYESLIQYREEYLSGKAEYTRQDYFFALYRFFSWLYMKELDAIGYEDRVEKFPSFTEKDLNLFIDELREEDYSKYYMHRIFIAVTQYARRTGTSLDPDKLTKISLPKFSQLESRALKDEKADVIETDLRDKLTEGMDKMRGEKLSFPITGSVRDMFRNYLIYLLQSKSAMRIGEVVELDIGDVHINKDNYGKSYVSVRHGKGDKARKIPLTSKMALRLEEYIDFRETYDRQIELEKLMNHYYRKDFKYIENLATQYQKQRLEQLKKERQEITAASYTTSVVKEINESIAVLYFEIMQHYANNVYEPSEALFVSNRGMRVSANTVMKWYKRAYNIKSHDLRHTAIQKMSDLGMQNANIMTITGHESPAVFERYRKKDFEDIQEDFGTLLEADESRKEMELRRELERQKKALEEKEKELQQLKKQAKKSTKK